MNHYWHGYIAPAPSEGKNTQVMRVQGQDSAAFATMATFQQTFGLPPYPTFSVSGETTTIGRQEECDIIVDSPAVSRQHARIFVEHEDFFLEDLGSRNGTLLNGEQVTARMALQDGDRVEISNLPFVFRLDSSLSGGSASWHRPTVVAVADSVADSDEDGDSVRRQMVSQGDQIPVDALEENRLRDAQLVAKIAVEDGARGWPVTNGGTRKLNHVLRLLHALRDCVDARDITDTFVEMLQETFSAAERIAVVLKTPDGGVTIINAAARHEDEKVEVCLPIVRSTMQNSDALMYADFWRESDNREAGAVRHIICCPIVDVRGHATGAVQLDGGAEQSLTREDLEDLVVLTHALSVSLDQAFASEAVIRRSLLLSGMSNARLLRSQLAPACPPAISGYRLHSHLIEAPDEAGDFVDYVRLSDGRVACLVIDVPGRGADATALMAVLSRLLSGAVSECGSPAEALRLTEMALAERLTQIPMIISVAVMVVDPESSSATIAVSGHCPVVGISRGVVKELDIADSPMGMADGSFSETQVTLYDNDVLLVMTDGISKVSSLQEGLLSRDQRMEMIRNASSYHHVEFQEHLVDQIERYRKGTLLTDDVAWGAVIRTSAAGTVDGEKFSENQRG